jgi:hypothetical protein
MNRHSSVIILALVGLLVAAPSVIAAPPSSPFAGKWTALDVPLVLGGDGSTEYVEVKGGSAHPQVSFDDDFSTDCFNAGSDDFWLSASLSGDVTGATMTGTFKSAKCGRLVLPWKGQTRTWTFDDHGTADPSDDTLWDTVTTWSRR